jgi:hypothetical protein
MARNHCGHQEMGRDSPQMSPAANVTGRTTGHFRTAFRKGNTVS